LHDVLWTAGVFSVYRFITALSCKLHACFNILIYNGNASGTCVQSSSSNICSFDGGCKTVNNGHLKNVEIVARIFDSS